MSVISRLCGRLGLTNSSCSLNASKSTFRMEIRQFRTKRQKKSSPTLPEPENLIVRKDVGFSALKRPVMFTFAFTGCTVAGCAIWQYENMREAARRSRLPNFDFGFGRKAGDLREEFRQWWNKLPDNEKLFIPICALNCLVFLGWRIPALQGVMMKWFLASPSGVATCLPMLLSTFSHYSFVHLGMNMFCLHSLMGPAVNILGQEQFLAMYLTGGVFSSLASYVFKVGRSMPGVSLGASGAVLAVIGVFGTIMPDARFQIIFIPGFTFTADTAIKALICLDTAGLVAGWRMFDHAAHLAGVLYGIFWCHAGSRFLWDSRAPLVNAWHQFRTGSKRRDE
eukprot:TRINITY_DN14302_c0_g1_i1.p1 TRINITY_DN14302_c0_g1~~TRINITY_DN14302_c0_g1_i1.p1  ORF type:complete len:338 (+),score=-9.84 TRINITY_DN14302_c0_g1_i1:32-1045(+)